MLKRIYLIIILISTCATLQAQDKNSNKQLKQANNPLANMKAFNIQHYYAPNLSGVDGMSGGTTMLRYAQPVGRFLVRATLPISTLSYSGSSPDMDFGSKSGLGDLNIFATYLLTDPTSSTQIGIGPQLTMPTGTNSFSNDTWNLGGALVVFAGGNPRIQGGGLVTYEHSLTDNSETPVTNKLIVQPFAFIQLGNGTYLRGAPSAIFDIERGEYNIPLGIGIGKIVKINNTVYNVFIEPQYSIASKGMYQPTFQLFTAINMQFLKPRN
ncbi:transporter [Aureibacter tunicatorum]|uniref:Neuromedin U n=1 Tax=Aureibacter tunicatorum TaxID=866807 RepID=A0AAE4BT17_9BACT|nr:transporter [Aureibacter tunicatorum]MDR6240356.1 hypothetical protein [Aureibacter tunicatorum]BDD05763.1 hypothetical protein AUTU_32460 [Aureibacter tunicatorum]